MLLELTYEKGANVSSMDVLCSAAKSLGIQDADTYLVNAAREQQESYVVSRDSLGRRADQSLRTSAVVMFAGTVTAGLAVCCIVCQLRGCSFVYSVAFVFLQRSEEGRGEVLEEDRVGKREKKIGGVPYFIVDSRWTLSGAQVQYWTFRVLLCEVLSSHSAKRNCLGPPPNASKLD